MKLAEVMDVNHRTTAKKSKGEVKSIEHERGANGGHVFTHRMANSGGEYHDPETHSFGADEGDKAMEHFAKYAGIKADTDSAAGAAT